MMRRLTILALLASTLAGCGWMGEKEKGPLEGKREAIIQSSAIDAQAMQKDGSETVAITLPEPAPNTVWGQAFGYPTHNPGHLILAGDLSTRLWSASIGKGTDEEKPIMPAPIIVENAVYALDTAGNVNAFALQDGKKLWSVPTRGEDQKKDELSAGGGLGYGRGVLVATNGSRDLIGLNPTNGVQAWRITLDAPLRGTPALIGGRAYVTDASNHIVAVDTASGAKIWTYNGAASEIALLGTPAPAVDERYAIGALSNGTITAVELSDGNTAWVGRFSSSTANDTSLTNLRDIASVPVIDGDNVYAINASGRMIALNAATGQRLWQKDVRGTGSLWPAGNAVFVVTREGVAARAAMTGDLIWEAALPQFRDAEDHDGPITWFGPYLLSGKLYAFGNNGDAVTFDPMTGKMLGVSKLDVELAANPAIAGGLAAMVDQSGRLSVRK